MNKICSSCMKNHNLNKQHPCVRCFHNEIYNSKNCYEYKDYYDYKTSFGTFKVYLKNYYKPR